MRKLTLFLLIIALFGFDWPMLPKLSFFGQLQQRLYSKKSFDFVEVQTGINSNDMRFTEQWLRLGGKAEYKPIALIAELKVKDFWGYTPISDFAYDTGNIVRLNKIYIQTDFKRERQFFSLSLGKLHFKYGDGLILDTYDEKMWGKYGTYMKAGLEPIHLESIYLIDKSFDTSILGAIVGYEDRVNPKNRVNWDLYVFRENIVDKRIKRYYIGLRMDRKWLGTNFEKITYIEAFKALGSAFDRKQKGVAFWIGKKTKRFGEKTDATVIWNYGYGGIQKTEEGYYYNVNSYFSHFGFGEILRNEVLGRNGSFSGAGLSGRHIINFHYQTDFKFGLSSGVDFTHLRVAAPLETFIDISNSLGNEIDFFFYFKYNSLSFGGKYCYLLPGSFLGGGSPAKMMELNVEVKF